MSRHCRMMRPQGSQRVSANEMHEGYRHNSMELIACRCGGCARHSRCSRTLEWQTEPERFVLREVQIPKQVAEVNYNFKLMIAHAASGCSPAELSAVHGWSLAFLPMGQLLRDMTYPVTDEEVRVDSSDQQGLAWEAFSDALVDITNAQASENLTCSPEVYLSLVESKPWRAQCCTPTKGHICSPHPVCRPTGTILWEQHNH